MPDPFFLKRVITCTECYETLEWCREDEDSPYFLRHPHQVVCSKMGNMYYPPVIHLTQIQGKLSAEHNVGGLCC